ncbi:CaiB/BaiF CoA transferase family protein [Umboniibacter marinipuniceus]|uniref:Crotonobetainyl-CoA:carnitine CoA-transferase CaiB-like acyl-CoA transferase n=1 Tax=Umboniibacter marinipuniceus TaxID=569599 RepID=A0A3M0AI12_9GAMM|nr:CaiB/BaiF CoA-transferase family protein [Umboniibacter marinipuniceus]RMA78852.1 crotonobetainyl-CoA:carnitine CoA-transferase CaiB-like acyl-CoA transferase [Umboniibacter marinipuniceus]
MSGPLAGLKVVDLSRILAGPWAGQVLADFGAEVIKIESLQGDDTRKWGPPWIDGSDDAAYFSCANRGKRSLCIDFRTEAGQKLIRQLIGDADVVIENYKVGGLKKYNLDYQSVKILNPEIVYCSITGFGQTGPKAKQAGYDAMIQASGGLMSITGPRDDESDAGPQKVGVAVADLMTGMYAVAAIQAALIEREKSGEGQYIDLALLDTQVAWLANQSANYLVGGVVPQREGTAHPNICPYQAFPATDGYFMLAVGNDKQFALLCQQLGQSQWSSDERFSTNPSRVKHRLQLVPMIAEITSTKPMAEWLQELSVVGVPVGPINTLDQVFEDEQIKHREMVLAQERSDGVLIKTVANPVKFSRTPLSYDRAPPAAGEDSETLLKEMGLSDAEIAKLRSAGVVN